MENEIKKEVEDGGVDKDCRCIVVTGSGRGFIEPVLWFLIFISWNKRRNRRFSRVAYP